MFTYHPDTPPTAICLATEALESSLSALPNQARSVTSNTSNSSSETTVVYLHYTKLLNDYFHKQRLFFYSHFYTKQS